MYVDDPDAKPLLDELNASTEVTKGGNKKIVKEIDGVSYTLVLKPPYKGKKDGKEHQNIERYENKRRK